MTETAAAFSSYLKLGPPRAPGAEKACLGALMLDPEGLSRIEGTLKDWHFFEEINRRIYRCVCRLFSSGRPVDIPIVHSEMQNDPLYQDSGGEAYLADLAASVGSAAHLREYASIVHEKALTRELQKAGTEIIEDCYQQANRKDFMRSGSGVKELLDRAENKIFKLAQEGSSTGFLIASEIIHPLMQSLQNAMQHKSYVTGLPTGFSKLDFMTSGFQKSNFVILAARPGEGKTAMALNIAAHVALTEKRPSRFIRSRCAGKRF
ncbi:MAG: hypothetical protein HY547_09450 [Elusimicrobia bacterium]|nr:hypothetical protein [Elusimicrobiota bacterium]